MHDVWPLFTQPAACPQLVFEVSLTACPRAATLEHGIAEGTLHGPPDTVTVAARQPSRELLLAAMQQRDVQLSDYDIVASRGRGSSVGSAAVAVEALWTLLYDEGGIPQVGTRVHALAGALC